MLNAWDVDYLLVGGYAVAIHGYPRATADIGVWVARREANARRMVAALREFGFDVPTLTEDLFVEPDRIVSMGVAPMRIELLTDIDGVEFEPCRERAVVVEIDWTNVPVIGLDDLKVNKRASGRAKDLADLEQLP